MKLKLTARKINDKFFPGAEDGYNARLVDEFLDQIVSDYNQIDDLIQNYEHTIKILKSRNEKLSAQNNTLESQLKIKNKIIQKSAHSNTDNSKVIDRLNQLENSMLTNNRDNQDKK